MSDALMMRRRALMQRKAAEKPGGLPSEYQRVNYIQSDGGQYLLTDYYASDKTSLEMSLDFSRFGRGWTIFGGRRNVKSNSFCLVGFNDTINLDAANTRHDVYWDTSMSIENITFNTQNATINGNKYPIGVAQKFSVPVPVTLFAQNTNGNISGKTAYKLLSVKISEENEVLREYVPCIRKADRKPGLYDLIGGDFLTNRGTGEFTYG